MPKIPSYTELLLAIQKWQGRLPGSTELMKAAAEAYLTDPELHDGLRKARPYTERLAHAALNCAAAAPEQHRLAATALAEVVPLAITEQNEARASEKASQAAAEKTRFGAAAAGLPEPEPVQTRWDERADLK